MDSKAEILSLIRRLNSRTDTYDDQGKLSAYLESHGEKSISDAFRAKYRRYCPPFNKK